MGDKLSPLARVRVRFEGDRVGSITSWAAFARDNEDLPELEEIEAMILAGVVWEGGGGAAPRWSIERFPSPASQRLLGAHLRPARLGRPDPAR